MAVVPGRAESLWTALVERAATGRHALLGMARHRGRHPARHRPHAGRVRPADGEPRAARAASASRRAAIRARRWSPGRSISGKAKRRMFLARVEGAAPRPGDPLFSEDLGDQASGMIVNAAPAPDGGSIVLAVVHAPSADGQHASISDPLTGALAALPAPALRRAVTCSYFIYYRGAARRRRAARRGRCHAAGARAGDRRRGPADAPRATIRRRGWRSTSPVRRRDPLRAQPRSGGRALRSRASAGGGCAAARRALRRS